LSCNKARIANVTTVVMIITSLIICLGSVYWFVVFNNESQTKNITNKTQTNTENEIIFPLSTEEPNVTDALQELRHEDCKIIKLDSPLYLDNSHYVSYNEFRSMALEKKLIILSPNESNFFMVVLIEDVQYIWVPN